MTQLMDGKALSNRLLDQMREEVGTSGIRPGLAVILVGEDPASAVYVRMKEKACEKVGFLSRGHRLPADVSEEKLVSLIAELNAAPDIHGILLQLPLPGHLNEKTMLNLIAPEKDVDGFHPVNVGRLLIGDPDGYVPCTPRGIMELLADCGVDLNGKHAVVIGRSNIVGKPVSVLLLREHATVTICHSRTRDLPAVAREADVLVAAIGKPCFVDETFVKEGAVVVDVGMNRVDDPVAAVRLFGAESPLTVKVKEKGYALCGDVHFDRVADKAHMITPVPGGVGPLTIAMLLKNTLDAAKRAEERSRTDK